VSEFLGIVEAGFLQAECHSCGSTNSVEALKADESSEKSTMSE